MSGIVLGAAARYALWRSLVPSLRAVAASLGPYGRAILVDMNAVAPREALTGASIARAIAAESGYGSIGPRILAETLFDAERDLGDGTAQLAVVIGAMLRGGLVAIEAGIAPQRLADELLELMAPIEMQLARSCRRIPSGCDELRRRIAIAAGAAPDILEDVLCAVQRCGPEGSVHVVAGSTRGVHLRGGDGFVFDCAPLDADAGAMLDPAHVLVVDEVIEDFGALVPVLEGFAARGKALVVAARDVRGGALATLRRNRRENGLRVAAIQPSAVAQQAAEVLEDLAVATGATLVADRFGTTLATLRPAMLGKAASFRLHRLEAVFTQPAGDAQAVDLRARLLAAEAQRTRYLSLDRERLERRGARLRGQWAEIEVAGATQRETHRMLARTCAAVASLRAAEAGGVVAGGGSAFVAVADHLCQSDRNPLSPAGAATGCAAAGLRAVRRQLLRNATDDGAAAAPEREDDLPVPDPLPIAVAIARRAISCTATLLRTDGLVADDVS